jgi:glycosyltransferase involved in cell wall biosynthesis
MTEQFLARGIGRPDLYTTVRSGMETSPFLDARPGEDRASVRQELGLAPTDFVIGTVARLAEHKGHDDILDAIGDDLRAHPDWKLLWVGDGWWGDRLRDRVREMGLAGQLVTTGLVPNARVPAMMRAMDVLVHPSYREGLPRTVPQALLTGVTPIAYDVDGTKEVCRNGETGVLVPLADRDSLRRAVVRMYEDPDERTRLAAEGRAVCSREFASEQMVAELERVYSCAVATTRGA